LRGAKTIGLIAFWYARQPPAWQQPAATNWRNASTSQLPFCWKPQDVLPTLLY